MTTLRRLCLLGPLLNPLEAAAETLSLPRRSDEPQHSVSCSQTQTHPEQPGKPHEGKQD